MKTLLKTTVLLLLAVLDFSISAEKTLFSKISDVHVYSDRAQITRIGSINLSKGEHIISLENLPDQIDKHSIQVTGSGNALLKDIQFKSKHFEEIKDERLKGMVDKKEVYLDSINILNDQLSHGKSEKAFIERIVSKLTTVPEKNQEPAELDPDKWIKMVRFYRERLATLSLENRKLSKRSKKFQKKIGKVDQELRDLNARKSKMKNVIEVTVMKKNQGRLKLNVSYMVYGVSWSPVYDIRVNTATKKMELTYNALIRQNTSEDWNNVKLNLSTARASISGDQPELTPWYLSIYQQMSRRQNSPSKRRAKAYSEAPMAMEMEKLSDMEGFGDAKREEYKPMKVRTASVQTRATSVVYSIAGKSTVESDNQEHKVVVTQIQFTADFQYSAVPKLSPHAYLKAKVKNSSEFSFLAGKSNIFLDQNFVGHSQLKLVSPSEEFTTYLGVDEGISVERKLIKKYNSDEGLIAKKNKVIYEYEIEIISHKKGKEELVIMDQLPISNNEDIKVALVSPKKVKDKDDIKINSHQFIEWKYTLTPGKKIKVPFVFSVKYPNHKSVAGL